MTESTVPELAPPVVAVGRQQKVGSSRKKLAPYFLTLPTLLYVLALVIYPLIFSILIAFRRFDPAKGLAISKMPFIGLDNFGRVLGDSALWVSLGNTFYIVVLAVIIEFAFGLGLALVLNNKAARLPGLALTLILTPMILPMVAAGLIWRMLYHLDYGAVNAFIRLFGLSGIDWLGDPKWVKPAIVLVDAWQWTPFVVLILYAGLRALPEEPFEAAKVDGASGLQTLWNITLPLLRWPIMVVLLIRVTDAFKTFDYVAALTGGGPGYSSQTLSFYTYLRGFKRFELGEAAAVSWLLLLIVYAACMLILAVMRPKQGEAF